MAVTGAVLSWMIGGCGGSGVRDATTDATVGPQTVETVETVEPDVVVVASRRCQRPTVHRGSGLRLADGDVLTAAHVVDGELRDLWIDDEPAAVVALDARLDLALVRPLVRTAERTSDGRPSWGYGAEVGAATIVTAESRLETEILREITLRVDHLSQRAVHERPALELRGAVERGVSGAPVLDGTDRVVAVVVLSDPSGGISYAVTLDDHTIEGVRGSGVTVRPGCPHK